MTGITEIYSVRGEENIRDGAMEVSDRIDSREAAAADALSRCRRDPRIRKVAYYKVRESGGFSILYSYDNPDAARPKPAGAKGAASRRPRKPVLRPPRKRGLLDRILDALKE